MVKIDVLAALMDSHPTSHVSNFFSSNLIELSLEKRRDLRPEECRDYVVARLHTDVPATAVTEYNGCPADGFVSALVASTLSGVDWATLALYVNLRAEEIEDKLA